MIFIDIHILNFIANIAVKSAEKVQLLSQVCTQRQILVLYCCITI